jgi:hypothetical protein
MAPQPRTGQMYANPHAELSQFGGIAAAIAKAAMVAAGDIQQPTTYKVTEIQIVVEPNPGPTAYSATMILASPSLASNCAPPL